MAQCARPTPASATTCAQRAMLSGSILFSLSESQGFFPLAPVSGNEGLMNNPTIPHEAEKGASFEASLQSL